MENKLLFVTIQEFRDFTGVGAKVSDPLVELWIQFGTNQLCSILDVKNIVEDSITDEQVDVMGCWNYFYLNNYNVSAIDKVQSVYLDELTTPTFVIDSNNKRKVWVRTTKGKPTSLYYDKIIVDYTFGYVDNEDDYANVPVELKHAVSFIGHGQIVTNSKQKGIIEEEVGKRKVKFATSDEAQRTMSIVKANLSKYRKLSVYS